MRFTQILSLLGRALHAPEIIMPQLAFMANRVPYYLSQEGFSWPMRRILLGVNSVCDAHCIMCDYGQKESQRMFFQNLRPSIKALELPLNRLKTLIDEIVPFKPVLEAHTVEPTLYRDLPSLADYAQRQGLSFRVFTSGARLAQIAEALVETRVDQIYVSLDGPQSIHDQIRGSQGSYDRAYDGILAVNKAKRKHPGSKTKIRINVTITHLNYNHLVELVKSVLPLDPFCIMFMHLNFVSADMALVHNGLYGQICLATPMGLGGTDPMKVSASVLADQFNQIKMLVPSRRLLIQPGITNQDELEVYYHHPQTPLRSKACLMPWQTTMVMPDGGVIVRNRCFHLVFGNIFDQPIMEIWNNHRYRAFRKALKQAKTFPACTRCYGAF
jgi:MoaA/NifB/PqqE/SkfB family radical SAM enzyme